MAAGALTERYAANLDGVLSCFDRIIIERVCDHLKRTLAGIDPPKIRHLLEIHANGIS